MASDSINTDELLSLLHVTRPKGSPIIELKEDNLNNWLKRFYDLANEQEESQKNHMLKIISKGLKITESINNPDEKLTTLCVLINKALRFSSISEHNSNIEEKENDYHFSSLSPGM